MEKIFIQKVSNVEEIEYIWLLQKAHKVALFVGTMFILILYMIILFYIKNCCSNLYILAIILVLTFIGWNIVISLLEDIFLKYMKLNLEELKRLEIFDRALQKGQKVFINIKTGEVFIKE